MGIMIIRYLCNDTIPCTPGECEKLVCINVCIRVVLIIQVLDRFCDSLHCLVEGKAIFDVIPEDIEGPTIWGQLLNARQLPNGRVEMRWNKVECHSGRWKRQGGAMKKRLIARKQRMPIQQGGMMDCHTEGRKDRKDEWVG